MVVLTMTPGIVQALTTVEKASPHDFAKLQRPSEPPLTNSTPGNPITHSQIIHLSKLLKQLPPSTYLEDQGGGEEQEQEQEQTPKPLPPQTLSSLLHSTTIYIPPPPPVPTKSPQYIQLMARLRAEQESHTYDLMLHPPPTRETFSQRFPSAPIFAQTHDSTAKEDDEDLTYDEVHRQMVLIINILVSIVCVACFVWVAARHWSVGKRLGLSMGGSLGVAVAEVAVYSGYVRKVREAKRKEKRRPEIKEIVKSWVLDKGEEREGVLVGSGNAGKDGNGIGDARRRKGKHR